MKTKEGLNSQVMSRREFIKLTLLGGTATALSACTVVIPEGGLPIQVVTATPNYENPATPTPETLPAQSVLFEGNPYSDAGKAEGDGGFRTAEPQDPAKILWGPFYREFDQYDEGVRDNARYRVTVGGQGYVNLGATDTRMFDGNNFGLYGGQTNLSNGRYTFEFDWPGLVPEGDAYNGYGWEVVVRMNDNNAYVDYVKVELMQEY